jgi:hypothetical protein
MVEHSRVDHVSAAFIAYKVLRLTREIDEMGIVVEDVRDKLYFL